MKKEKLYDSNIGTFKMNFGFNQPGTYRPNKWVSIRKPKSVKK
tara:strand:+ start:329 stop:457 length:129 start_codon:yes stop_codon:yes gene_type:complete